MRKDNQFNQKVKTKILSKKSNSKPSLIPTQENSLS